MLEARCESKGISISKLCSLIGTSEEEHKTFMALLETTKNRFVAEGRRNLRVDWLSAKDEVKGIRKRRLKITEGKDASIPYACYLQ